MTTLTVVLIAAAFFLIGAGIGHLYSRKTGANNPSVQELEKKLEQTEQQLKRYQQEVTEHFVTVSHLTTNIAQSYRQIHEHLATSAIRLASPEIGRQLLKAGGSDLSLVDEDGNPLISAEDIEPPRDYAPKVPGGILSEEYGLDDNDLSKGHPNAANSAEEDEDDSDPTHNVS
ncbi:MAG: DUF1043 family protein [Porticoccaceae bacterium]|nr:DUF1043 family protein [Porticoccaceae bacterium]MBT5577323.1 DUF1043 family protein [Porticoccaceae bacterium]MBT7375043.1 DUF1043 family protein [Porticoccaceae bacterium]